MLNIIYFIIIPFHDVLIPFFFFFYRFSYEAIGFTTRRFFSVHTFPKEWLRLRMSLRFTRSGCKLYLVETFFDFLNSFLTRN